MWKPVPSRGVPLSVADPLVDLRVFREGLDVRPGHHVLGAALPVEALLSTLRDDPARITLCTGNHAQEALARFHQAAIACLDVDAYARLIGWKEATREERRDLHARVHADRRDPATPVLQFGEAEFREGLIATSHARRFLAKLAAQARAGLGEREADSLLGLAPMSPEERREAFARWRARHSWSWTRLCFLLRYLPGRFLRSHLGLHVRASARFLRRTSQSLLDSLELLLYQGLAQNPVFRHALTGELPRDFVEGFLAPEVYARIQERIDRVTIVPHALFDGLCGREAESRVDRLYLGIGPLLVRTPRGSELAQRCSRLLLPEGRVLALSLLPRDPLKEFDGLVPLEHESIRLTTREATGLYRLVSVHRVRQAHESRRPNGDRLVSMA